MLPTELSLRCPTCAADGVERGRDALTCPHCGASYSTVAGRPVLIAATNDVFPASRYHSPPQGVARRRLAPPGASVNLSLRRSMERLTVELRHLDAPRVLVVGAGVQRAELLSLLAGLRGLVLVPVDVDPSADVDAYCDAHDLPFADACFDAVVVTAVLEHVLDPVRVMTEIHRVLRAGGLLYSEMPFIQQVHEGAYDFTRYTLSGHRRLAGGFAEIESGATAGPATALLWSIEHFLLAVADNRARRVIKLAVRTALAWLKHIDRLIAARPAALDAASCTYFLGRRRDEGRTPNAAIIDGYRGAQRSPDSRA